MAKYDAALQQWGSLETEKFDDGQQSSLGQRILETLSKYAPKVAQVYFYHLCFTQNLFAACRKERVGYRKYGISWKRLSNIRIHSFAFISYVQNYI